ncbi:MAG: 2-C-methyl-D-erythritol 4-phosphate cytidylyltransferase [Treponema sp.]|nr:2-C-methyl-D-erythritol 4-phosphate cytidylyltransferase [Treponema sp.]
MDAALKAAAVICAAGSSSRMGGIKKEYQKLPCGDTVLGSSVRAFAAVPSVKIIVIAVPEGGEAETHKTLPPAILSAGKPDILFVTGGSTRCASVYNALSSLTEFNPDYVLIHDGARPWVSVSLIENIIAAVKKYNAVIPALLLTETPKEFETPLKSAAGETPAVFIKNHLKRINTGIAQTPQGFKFAEILKAHEKAAGVTGEEFTDDAEIWGRFCGKVAVIPGEAGNKKITFPEDLT